MKRILLTIIIGSLCNMLTTASRSQWSEFLPPNPEYSAIEKIDVSDDVKRFMNELAKACPIDVAPNELTLESVSRVGFVCKYNFRYLKSLPEMSSLSDFVEYILSSFLTDDCKNIYMCIGSALFSYYDVEFNIHDESDTDYSILLKQDGSIVNLSLPEVPKDALNTRTVTTIRIEDGEKYEVLDDGESDMLDYERAHSKENEEIYVAVEEQAEFPGGINGLMEWLPQNVHYPDEAFKLGIEGLVRVRFVIRKDGTADDAVLLQSVNEILDQEALRLIGIMPKWTPAKINGEFVSSYFVLPVNFRLPPSD